MNTTHRAHWNLITLTALTALASVACSSPGTGGGGCPAGFTCTPNADGSGDSEGVGDANSAADASSDDGATVADGFADAGSVNSDVGQADTWTPPQDAGAPDTWTPPQDAGAPDTGNGAPDAGEPDVVPGQPVGNLYAHTKDTLYFLDVPAAAFKKVGVFTFNKNKGLVTDIALNQWGNLFAVTYGDLFQCNRMNAKCVWLAKLPQEFNGLTFIPEGVIDPNQEALVGIAGKGTWYHVQFGGGKVTLKAIGGYGGSWWSSGDAFSVVGVGTYATLKKCNGCDNYLAEVDPASGKIKKLIGKTGKAKGLFGLAWWAGVFYAVSSDGNVYVLDVKSGNATKVQGISIPKGVKWWGAGVSTRADG